MSKAHMILNTVIVMALVFVCSIVASAIFPNLGMLYVSIIGCVAGGCISFPIMLLLNRKKK